MILTDLRSFFYNTLYCLFNIFTLLPKKKRKRFEIVSLDKCLKELSKIQPNNDRIGLLKSVRYFLTSFIYVLLALNK